MSIPTMSFEQLKDIVSKQEYDVDNSYDGGNNELLNSLFNTYNTVSTNFNNGKLSYVDDEYQKRVDEYNRKMKSIVPNYKSDEERQVWQTS
jgi:hypothetical protein